MIDELERFIADLSVYRQEINKSKGTYLTNTQILYRGKSLARQWLSKFSNALRERKTLADEIINNYDAEFEYLFELSSKRNRLTSFKKTLKKVLKNIQKDVLIPLIKSQSLSAPGSLSKIISKLLIHVSPEEQDYLKEAIRAMNKPCECLRASIVMAWAAGMDRIHKKIEKLSFAYFNKSCAQVKKLKTRLYRHFRKEIKVSNIGELREVSDRDVLLIITHMGLIDPNQRKILGGLLDTRNTCGHPGAYFIDEIGLANFLNNLDKIIFSNTNFSI